MKKKIKIANELINDLKYYLGVSPYEGNIFVGDNDYLEFVKKNCGKKIVNAAFRIAKGY